MAIINMQEQMNERGGQMKTADYVMHITKL